MEIEIVRCKRCNHVLTSKKSIELGYGKTCYRIHKLHETNKPEINKPEVNQEIAFLKCEINTLKKMIRNIQVNRSTIPIERIKQNRPEQKMSCNKANFGDVVKEMKEVFEKVKSGYKYLKPAFPNEEIIVPPLVQILV